MERDDGVRAIFHAKLFTNGRLRRLLFRAEERVDHHVADKVNARRVRHVLFREELHADRIGDEKQIADGVDELAVDLLGHVVVVRTKARLHMNDEGTRAHAERRCERNFEPEFRSDKRAGDGRVHVAHHEDRLRLLGLENRLEALHDLGGLLRVGTASDLELHVGTRDGEFLEENFRKLRVVMLARVHEARLEMLRLAEGRKQRCDLHEVRTGARDAEDFCCHEECDGSSNDALTKARGLPDSAYRRPSR